MWYEYDKPRNDGLSRTQTTENGFFSLVPPGSPVVYSEAPAIMVVLTTP